MSYPRVGDLVSYHPQHYGEPWIDKVGIVMAEGTKPPIPFEEPIGEHILLVRWASETRDEWVEAAGMMVVSRALIKSLTEPK